MRKREKTRNDGTGGGAAVIALLEDVHIAELHDVLPVAQVLVSQVITQVGNVVGASRAGTLALGRQADPASREQLVLGLFHVGAGATPGVSELAPLAACGITPTLLPGRPHPGAVRGQSGVKLKGITVRVKD